MIFGSVRDVGTLLHIGRELVQDVVEQEILLYKVNLEETLDNIYGEATHKYIDKCIKPNYEKWEEFRNDAITNPNQQYLRTKSNL